MNFISIPLSIIFIQLFNFNYVYGSTCTKSTIVRIEVTFLDIEDPINKCGKIKDINLYRENDTKSVECQEELCKEVKENDNLNDALKEYVDVKDFYIGMGSKNEMILSSLNAMKELEKVWFGRVPDNIGETLKHLEGITSLKTLIISSSKLKSIPTEVFKLTTLTHLHYFGNKLTTEIPDAIKDLSNLEVLELTRCGLTKISDEVSKLASLQQIFLAGNDLENFPTGITQTTITRIQLDGKLLEKLTTAQVGYLTEFNTRTVDIHGEPDVKDCTTKKKITSHTLSGEYLTVLSKEKKDIDICENNSRRRLR